MWATTRSGGSRPRGACQQLHRPEHRRRRTGSRPGPTAPCGSPTAANSSIGRITTSGVVTNYTDPSSRRPSRDRGRTRRRPLVHQQREQLDRADHDRRRRSPTSPIPASTARSGSRLDPTVPSGSPTTGTTRSGGSRPAASVSSYTDSEHQQLPAGSRPGPTAPLVHQQRQQFDRADHDRRRDQQLHRPGHQPARRDRGRTRTARSGSPTARPTRSGGSRRAAPSAITSAPASAARARDRRRA